MFHGLIVLDPNSYSILDFYYVTKEDPSSPEVCANLTSVDKNFNKCSLEELSKNSSETQCQLKAICQPYRMSVPEGPLLHLTPLLARKVWRVIGVAMSVLPWEEGFWVFRGMAGQMGGKPRGKGGGAARTEKKTCVCCWSGLHRGISENIQKWLGCCCPKIFYVVQGGLIYMLKKQALKWDQLGFKSQFHQFLTV